MQMQPERDRLFVNSRSFGGVESIELSTIPGDLGPPEELQREKPLRRRRSDRILGMLPSVAMFLLVVAAVIYAAHIAFGSAA